MTRGHCRDCGEALDQFGICPFADPERAKAEHAPVNCGYTAQENARRVEALLGRATSRPKLSNFMGIAGDQSVNSRGST